MSWDYRVVQSQHRDKNTYRIHSAFYNEQGEIQTISKTPIIPVGYENELHLKNDLEQMLKAFSKPTLIYEDFVINPSLYLIGLGPK